jgi:hypothetical protein
VQGLTNGLSSADPVAMLSSLATALAQGLNIQPILDGVLLSVTQFSANVFTTLSQAWLALDLTLQTWLTNTAAALLLWFTTLIVNLGMWLLSIWTSTTTMLENIRASVERVIGAVRDWLERTWRDIEDAARRGWQAVYDAIAGFVDSIVVKVMEVVTVLTVTLVEAFNAISAFLTTTAGAAFNWFVEYVLNPFSRAISAISEGIVFLIGLIEDAVNKLAKLTGGVNNSPLMGHSPSPFETSIRGVSAALSEANDVLASTQAAMARTSMATLGANWSGAMAGGLAGAGVGGMSVSIDGGLNFPNVRSGRDALGVRRELSREALRASMTKRG